MRSLLSLLMCAALALAPRAAAQEPIFAPGAKLKVEAEGGVGGEGPAWHPKLGLLTSGNGHINQLDRKGKSAVYRKGAGTNGLLFDSQGRLLACEPEKRRVTRTELDGTITVLTDNYEGKKYNQPNDITVDALGRIYFSDPRYGNRDDMQIRDEKGQTIEGVYRIDAPAKVTRVIGREVDRANGVLVSADDRFLYVADNNNDTVGAARTLWRFDLHKDGSVDLKSKKLIYDWGKGRGPDGVKQDQKGRLYVAAGLNKPSPPAEPATDVKGGIYVLSPEGKLLEFLPVPTDEVTNCAFGADDLQTLYITGGGTIYSIRTTTPGHVLLRPTVSGTGSAEPSFKRQEDVIYGRKPGLALTMDVFTPTAKANGAAVIWCVSGGWFSSHESINGGAVDEYTKRGYTVFAVVHGSQPKYAIPEVLQDMHRAVRFIRYNAKKFGIDPDRIGITGGSAGGHLSLMQGTAGKDGDPKSKDPVERESSRVQAVACFFPPTDFLNWGEKDMSVLTVMPKVLPRVMPAFDFTTQDPKTGSFVRITDPDKVNAILRDISPISHVTPKSAPTLIIFGDKDRIVPFQQAEILAARFLGAAVEYKLITKVGADHGWKDMDKDLVTMADWFDKHLVKAPAQAKKTADQPKVYESGIVWEQPNRVTPGTSGSPPSDAIVLFDGKNMDAWIGGEKWPIEDGATTAKSFVKTKQPFGDVQLHVEFASPLPAKGKGQGRGNNGIGFMDAKYEVQVLDSWDNPTYLDGMCAAIYKQRPPMVAASRKPGEWQTYDIVFEAPRFKDGKLARPAFVTVLHNGVLVQNHVEILGNTAYDTPPKYTPHAEKLPLVLMYHGDPVRFRNIWIRDIRELEGKKSEAKGK